MMHKIKGANVSVHIHRSLVAQLEPSNEDTKHLHVAAILSDTVLRELLESEEGYVRAGKYHITLTATVTEIE